MSQNFESLTLQELQRSLGDSVYTALEPTDWGLRLVCAKEKASDGSGHAASFWVTFVSERWYVCYYSAIRVLVRLFNDEPGERQVRPMQERPNPEVRSRRVQGRRPSRKR
jgi:hypothetical protein